MNDLELCLSIVERLNSHERAVVSRKINALNSACILSDMQEQCIEDGKELCEKVLDKTGLDIQSKDRKAYVTSARRYICKTLRDKGYSFMAIGKALNMNHSSVIFHCRKASDAEEYPRFYPEYHKVKKIIENEEVSI